MSKPSGDDFQDDFVYDDLVAFSEREDDALLSSFSEDEDSFSEDEASTQQKASTSQLDAQIASKKRKRREKEKERKKRRLQSIIPKIEPASIALQPRAQLADYFSSIQAKVYPNFTSLELDDIRVQEEWIEDTSAWSSSRTLDQLSDFLAKTVPTLRTRLQQKSKNTGSPTLIFITGAALRVIDVTRVLKSKQIRGEKGGEVAKLFARHFKIEDHIAYLRRTKIGAAVGTPGRIGKLLELNALTVSALTHIMLDLTHQDLKKRNILDIPETREEVFKAIFGAPKVRDNLRQGKTHIVVL